MMKRYVQCICIILVLATVLAVPVQAAETATPRASSFFTRVSVYLWHTTGNTFEIWFDVTATRGMDELGAKTIKVERSSDNVNWETVKTFSKDTYSQMTKDDTGMHASCVTYTGATGYYYRARVTIYAKDSTGIGEDDWYTDTLHF